MPLALRGEAISRAWLSDRQKLDSRCAIGVSRGHGMCLATARNAIAENADAGRLVRRREGGRHGIVPSGEIFERSGAIEFGDGAGRAISGEMGWKPCRHGAPQIKTGLPATPTANRYFPPEMPPSLPRTIATRARRTRPARNLPKFCVYPLGIVRKRPYDGGLSFSALMQIGVEGGV